MKENLEKKSRKKGESIERKISGMKEERMAGNRECYLIHRYRKKHQTVDGDNRK